MWIMPAMETLQDTNAQIRRAEEAVADALPAARKRRGIKRALFWTGYIAAGLLPTPINAAPFVPSVIARIAENHPDKMVREKVSELKVLDPQNKLVTNNEYATFFKRSSVVAGSLFGGLVTAYNAALTYGPEAVAHAAKTVSEVGVVKAIPLILAISYVALKTLENGRNDQLNIAAENVRFRAGK